MIWSLEKMLLKKQVTRRTSTALIPSKKLGVLAKGNSAPPSSFPLGFGAAPSSQQSESSSGGRDSRSGSAIPAGCPESDHPVWALGSIPSLRGALQSSPLMCGISWQLWGASGWPGVLGAGKGSLVSKSFLPKVQHFFLRIVWAIGMVLTSWFGVTQIA